MAEQLLARTLLEDALHDGHGRKCVGSALDLRARTSHAACPGISRVTSHLPNAARQTRKMASWLSQIGQPVTDETVPTSLSVILCGRHNRREGAYYAEQREESSA